MELEDLKSIWKNNEFKPKDTNEIAAMLRGNSVSIVSKLKKSVWFELLLTIAAERRPPHLRPYFTQAVR